MTCSSLGFIGLGAMGMPMAQNLLRKGFRVTVMRHRDPDAPVALAGLGAGIVDSPAEFGGLVEAVILMLPTSREVEEVVLGSGGFGSRGIAGVMSPGQIVLDMGTSDPASTRRLAAQLAVQGVAFLDAPVTGGVKGAEAGTLTIMVGGPSDAVERAQPVLRALGTVVIHAGESGAGHVVKLLNNLIALSTTALIAEALALADRSGVARSTVLEVLEHGSANSTTLRGVSARLREGRFDPGFKLALARKDLRLAEELAQALGVRLEVAAAARAMYDRACDAGKGDLDVAAIAATKAVGA
ncbi:MAG: NAD(P)-dependent oxidoreductase [bacterium]|nr:NAD(P)-dependent oxidoreductase [bacterium]